MTEASAGVPRSPAAQAASRRNGARSRGPVSRAGKARSARNAFKHGFCSRRALPAILPHWLAEIELELLALPGQTPERPSPYLDQLLLACFLLHEIDQVIEATLHRAVSEIGEWEASGAVQSDAGVSTPVLVPHPDDVLSEPRHWWEMARLAAYRRRFRGRRDGGLKKLHKMARAAIKAMGEV